MGDNTSHDGTRMIVTPEGWYMIFWAVAGLVGLLPIYLFLYLIWTQGR